MDLSFDKVTKFYGPVIGVNDVSCQVTPGITGLLGANGAGKSTLLKLASGQLRPSLGDVRVGQHRAWSSAAKRRLGYCPDINTFYEEMTGREFVLAMTRLYGYSLGEARRRTEAALEEVGMSDRATRRLAGCSHGMRQRIKLAQALVNDPEVLLLDEPMTGIDPAGRHHLGELLTRKAATGMTVLVSTHILSELEELAERILMIGRGRVIATGTLPEIRRLLANEPFVVRIDCGAPRRLAARLLEHAAVLAVEVRDEVLTVRTRQPDEFFAHVNALASEPDIEVTRLETLDAGADAVFAYLEPRA
ncbi:MAG: ABC transporter ATP-binding protein [Pirellulales bacterium]|nr:ABC transporter ATP-binding protein [Planctomycetales bacterium]